MVQQIQANPDSVVSQFIDWTGVEEMVEHPDELTSPWYGQLMRVPQILAYIVQLDAWFQTFHVSVV